ncbi:MAG: inositol monophosphatase family protein [Dehalococcoidia bacterium]
MSTLPLATNGTSALELARSVIYDAGQILLDRLNKEMNVRQKGRADIVTDVDYEVERFVLGRLREAYPDFGILAEESGAGGDATATYTWIVDPLDGTRNYAMGVPLFAVTMALARGDEVVLGLTFDPTRGELFTAEHGRGAFLNGEPISISSGADFAGAVIGTDMGYNDAMAAYAIQLLDRLWPGMQAIRIMGSAALGLAYAAAGRIDLYFHHHLASWDIAAGILLAHEAGGVVTDRNGRPITIQSPSILLSNRALHTEFLRRTEGLPWRDAEG